MSVRGAWNEWLAYFLRGVADQATDAIAKAERLRSLQDEWRSRITQRRGTALTLRLADYTVEAPVVTIPQVQEMLGVAYNTARSNTDKLVDAGMLQQWGDWSYGKAYVAEDILRAIGGDETAR